MTPRTAPTVGPASDAGATRVLDRAIRWCRSVDSYGAAHGLQRWSCRCDRLRRSARWSTSRQLDGGGSNVGRHDRSSSRRAQHVRSGRSTCGSSRRRRRRRDPGSEDCSLASRVSRRRRRRRVARVGGSPVELRPLARRSLSRSPSTSARRRSRRRRRSPDDRSCPMTTSSTRSGASRARRFERTLCDCTTLLQPFQLGRVLDDGLRRGVASLARLRTLRRATRLRPWAPACPSVEAAARERDDAFDPGGSASELHVLAGASEMPVCRCRSSSTGCESVDNRTYVLDFAWPEQQGLRRVLRPCRSLGRECVAYDSERLTALVGSRVAAARLHRRDAGPARSSRRDERVARQHHLMARSAGPHEQRPTAHLMGVSGDVAWRAMATGPDLFAAAVEERLASRAPLAARLRPRSLDEVVGQQHLLGPGQVAAGAHRVGPAVVGHPLGPARHRQDDDRPARRGRERQGVRDALARSARA